ncbi:hypothetical protein AKJ43_01450 [candidate division MSBL1 archaeon SCGC-AAA261D19]|uniref:dITP/XTP pyrophosphatase n=1 Tax=candidate division MSBL1 archaeon SCGC-AAA261D19 TaxID=1698273 RepID=A0A133V7Z3_9EURY|nr:hypothetical protein AKJ43_01450 [candidate division MSBL1 archaeon SCGC-AAA261D19]
MTLNFVTSNRKKFEEAKLIAESHGIELNHRNVPYVEIQDDRLVEIVKPSAQQACALIGEPCFVEDSGLFVEEMGGFPGPYSSYVYRRLGNGGILKLMEDRENRRAKFMSAVGYCEPGSKPTVFKGMVEGSIAFEPSGSKGFGFDPIFIPDGGGGRTFAEMTSKMKNAFSHRAEAIGKFVKWCARNRKLGGG